MESYAYHPQQSAPYPHAHQQPQHPNQTSPVMQTQPQPNYAQHQQPQQMAHPQMQPMMGYGQAYAIQQPYGVSPSQAAAMATAAASGYNPAYSMASDSSMMPQTSPRLQQVKTDGSNMQRQTDQSPRQQGQMNAPSTMPGPMGMASAQAMPNSMPQQLPPQQMQQPRRMSHVGSPAVQNPQQQQPSMNAPPRPSAPPQQVAPPQAVQPPPQPSPEVPAAGTVEESPLYVNAKQFHRILKRRMARQKLEEALRLTNKGRKPYLHESRHNHAMRRPRGPGGRFLTAEEVSAMEAKDGVGAANGSSDFSSNGATNGSTKRKREYGGMKNEASLAKKVKSDDDDEEDDEDEDG